jgi:hypothetical protein
MTKAILEFWNAEGATGPLEVEASHILIKTPKTISATGSDSAKCRFIGLFLFMPAGQLRSGRSVSVIESSLMHKSSASRQAPGVIRTHNLLIRSQMVRLFTQTELMALGRRVDSSSKACS